MNALGAFLAPFRGLKLLTRPGLRRYVVAPLAINVLLFAGSGWLAYTQLDRYLAHMLPQDGWLHYLEWLVWPLAVAAYLLLVFYGFTVVANLIGAPFNSILAARVEERFTGRPPPESQRGLMAEILPAVTGEVGKLLHFLKWAIPVLILMLIPGVNLIGSALWLLLGFWFLAVEYIDYPMGNHQVPPRDQRRLLRRHPLQAWAFGAAANLLMLIPGINLAAMPAAVAGATIWWVEGLSKDEMTL